jgi:triose/dihydroxyacetone kinase / FAD-AMP lyase (cyclizing)
LGKAVVANLASIGVAMEHCHVPGRKAVGAEHAESKLLGAGQCEIGMGLHNEPGVRKAEITSPELLIAELVQMVLNSRDGGLVRKASRDGAGDEVVLFVNNLGGMSQLEMGAVVDEALTQLGSSAITILIFPFTHRAHHIH